MRFIDHLIECNETSATATVCFAPESFAVADGRVIEAALVECVAQTVAAAAGYRARSAGAGAMDGSGMLAAVSNFLISSVPQPGETLHIKIVELKRFGPMLLVRGEIFSEGQLVAAGELTIHA